MICWKIALCVLVWAAILDGVTTVESKDPVDRGMGETVVKLGSSLMQKRGGDLKDLGTELFAKVLPKEGKEILNTVTSVGKTLAPVLSMAGPIGGAINSAISMFSPEPEPTPDPRIDKLLEDTAEIKNMVQETKQSINEVKTQLADLKEQMQEDISNLGEEMKETMNTMKNEFLAAFDELQNLVTVQFEKMRSQIDKLGQQIKDQFEGQKAYEAFLQFAVMVDAKLEQFDSVVKPAMNQSFADKDQNEKLKLRCITPGYDPLSIISDIYTMAIKNCLDPIELPQACLLKEVMAATKYTTQTAALLSNFMEGRIFQLWTYQIVCAGLIHSEPNSLINDNLIFARKVDQTFKAMSDVLPPLIEAYWSEINVEEFVKKHIPDPRPVFDFIQLTIYDGPFKSCGTALDNQYPVYEHLCIRIYTNGSRREFETIPKNHNLAISFRYEQYEFVVMRTPVMDKSEAAARLKSYTDWLREDVPPQFKEADKSVHIKNELIGWAVNCARNENNTSQLNRVKADLKNTDDVRNRVYAHYFAKTKGDANSWGVDYSDPNVNSTCTGARNNQIAKCRDKKGQTCEKCEHCHYHRCTTDCKDCCTETYMGSGPYMMSDAEEHPTTDDIPNQIIGCFFVWHNYIVDGKLSGNLAVFVVHGL